MKPFMSYHPWLPLSIVMSPVMRTVDEDEDYANDVGFFAKLPEELLTQLHFNTNPECLTITVFSEYEFSMTEKFIKSTVAELVSKSTKTPNAALLLTPKSTAEINTIKGLAEVLGRCFATPDQYRIDQSNQALDRECFGIYIQNGSLFFFAKSNNRKTLEYHLVPETNIVISICWEGDFLGQFKKDLFDLGACLVLHPSANSNEITRFKRYGNSQYYNPQNDILAIDARWKATVQQLLKINPLIQFVHVDLSLSGLYLEPNTENKSISLEKSEEKNDTSDRSSVVKRILRFSSIFADDPTYTKAKDARTYDPSIQVPEAKGCVIM